MGVTTAVGNANIDVTTWIDSQGTDTTANLDVSGGAYTATVTLLTTTDKSVFAAGDLIYVKDIASATAASFPAVDSEIMYVTGTTGTNDVTVFRGYGGTTAKTYENGNDIFKINVSKDGELLAAGVGDHSNGDPGAAAALLRFDIPSRETLGIPDNSVLRTIDIYLENDTGSAGGTLNMYSLKPEYANFSETTATWGNYAAGFSSSWRPAELSGDPIFDKHLASKPFVNGGTHTFNISAGIDFHDWDFGSRVACVLYGSTAVASQFNDDSDTDSGAAVPVYNIAYEVPTPSSPTITVTPNSNGIDGTVTITKASDSLDLQSHEVCWSTADTTPGHDDNPTTFSDIGRTTFDTTELAGSPLATDDTAYYFTVIAEDSVNDDDDGGVSNVVYIIRPEIATGSTTITSSGAIGDTITLVVASETIASHPYNGKFRKVRVNWDSAASDTDDDYAVYVSEDGLSTTSGNITITHKYSKANAGYSVKVIIEDADGWRSDTVTLGTTPAIAESNPVANLTTSRTKALEATYGEKGAAVVLSGQHSLPVGSDRKIANYLFSYEADLATTIATANAYNNDNSVFDSGSKRVAMVSMGVDSMNTAVFKVFGLASFRSDGTTPVTDTDSSNFSHYRQAVDTITIESSRADDVSAGSSTGNDVLKESQASTPNYFKTVDCVLCTAVDTDDDADRYALRVWHQDDVVTANKVAITTIAPFHTPINTEIRWKSNPTSTNKSLKYAWGGFTQISAGNEDFVVESKTIVTNQLDVVDGSVTVQCTAAHGFQVGDYVHINASNDDYDEYVTVKKTNNNDLFYYTTDKPNTDNTVEGTVTMHAIEIDSLASGADDRNVSDPDWAACGFYVGDIIKLKGASQASASFAAPKYYKIAGMSSTATGTAFFDRMTIERDTAKLTKEEQGYITTEISDNDDETDVVITRHNMNPTLTAALYNTAAADDGVTFIHGVIDDDDTSFVVNFDDTTQKVRLVQPATLDLDTLVTNGDIAIESATMARSGGIGAVMSLGESRYPGNVMRTKMGLPKITAKLHILTQAGLRDIFSLVEADRFDYVFLDSRKVDTPTTAYRQYRMKLESGSLVQDGSTSNRYVANCNFIVVGEDVS